MENNSRLILSINQDWSNLVATVTTKDNVYHLKPYEKLMEIQEIIFFSKRYPRFWIEIYQNVSFNKYFNFDRLIK